MSKNDSKLIFLCYLHTEQVILGMFWKEKYYKYCSEV